MHLQMVDSQFEVTSGYIRTLEMVLFEDMINQMYLLLSILCVEMVYSVFLSCCFWDFFLRLDWHMMNTMFFQCFPVCLYLFYTMTNSSSNDCKSCAYLDFQFLNQFTSFWAFVLMASFTPGNHRVTYLVQMLVWVDYFILPFRGCDWYLSSIWVSTHGIIWLHIDFTEPSYWFSIYQTSLWKMMLQSCSYLIHFSLCLPR